MYEKAYRTKTVKLPGGQGRLRIPGFVRGSGENEEAMSAAYRDARKAAKEVGASDEAAHEAGLAAGKAVLAAVRSANLAKARKAAAAKARSKRLAKARAARAVKAKREKRNLARKSNELDPKDG